MISFGVRANNFGVGLFFQRSLGNRKPCRIWHGNDNPGTFLHFEPVIADLDLNVKVTARYLGKAELQDEFIFSASPCKIEFLLCLVLLYIIIHTPTRYDTKCFM